MVAATASLSTVVSSIGLDPTLSSLAQGLPPAAQAALSTTAQIYGTAQTALSQAGPTLSMVSTIASGKVPSAQVLIGGLAAAATMTMGPEAGAIVGAVGELGVAASAACQALFKAFGLNQQNPPTWDYVAGFMRRSLDTIPNGPTDPDWIHLQPFSAYSSFWTNGDANHPKPAGNFNDAMGGILMGNAYQQPLKGVSGAYQPNAFDRFVATLLISNIELWANAQAYVPSRALVAGAAMLWNATHDASKTVTYQPTPGVDDREGLVSLILGRTGGYADNGANSQPDDAPALTVNLGPTIQPKAAPVTVSIPALTFGQGGTAAQDAANPAIQQAAYYAIYPVGTDVPFSAQAFQNLLGQGVSQAYFDSLSGSAQTIIREAGVPVGNDTPTAPLPQGNLYSSGSPPTAADGGLVAAVPASTGIGLGAVALVGTVAAAGLALWAFLSKKKGVLTP